MLNPKYRVTKALVLLFVLGQALLYGHSRAFAAERIVGLQSAPSVAMALPWFAEEARLYAKYDRLSIGLHRVVGNRHGGDERW